MQEGALSLMQMAKTCAAMQRLPDDFQTAEFLMQHGFLDMIVDPKDIKSTVARALDYLAHLPAGAGSKAAG